MDIFERVDNFLIESIESSESIAASLQSVQSIAIGPVRTLINPIKRSNTTSNLYTLGRPQVDLK